MQMGEIVARALLENIPESRLTAGTLQRMYRLVDAGKTDPAFQEIIRKVVNRAMPGRWKNYRGEAETILAWVKRTINYRRDPVDVELLQDVWRTLDTQAGDCDDFSVLLAASLESIGSPIRFVTVSTRQDHSPSHVYIESFIDGRWTPLDGIVQSSFVGWQPTTGITNRQVWTRNDVGLSGYEEKPMEGLGMIDWTDDGIHAVRNTGDDTISHTRANPMPGEVIVSRRRTPSDNVRRLADPAKMELPGGSDGYSVPRVIQSHLRPEQLHTDQVPAADVPYEFDLQRLVGKVPTWESNPNAIFPEPRTDADRDLVDLSGGLGNISRADDRGRVASPVYVGSAPVPRAGIERVVRRRMLKRCKCGTTLDGLGIVSDDDSASIQQYGPPLSAAVSNSVANGEVPNQPSAISSAIDLALNIWSTKKAIDAAKPKTVAAPLVRTAAAAGAPSSMSPWVIPAIAAAGILVAVVALR